MFDRIRNYWKSESDKLQGKSTRQKAEYVWEYYWLWIVGILCAVGFVVFSVHRYTTSLKDHWFYLMLADTRAEVGTGSELWEGFVAYSGYDPTVKMVEFNDDAYFDYSKNHAAGNQYYNMFVGFTDAGVLDAVTMGPDQLSSLGESGRLMDLRDERCAGIFDKYADRLIYSIPYDTEYSTDPVPVGIDISDSILITKYHIYENGCALGVGAQSGRTEAVERFLDYIYSE